MNRWWLVICVVACAVPPRAAWAQSAARPLVFVTDVRAAPALKAEAELWTTALCAALSQDRRVEVLCAPDVRQILDYAAMGSLSGNEGPAAAALDGRLAAVRIVVTGNLVMKAPGTLALVVAAGPRALAGAGDLPVFEVPTVRVQETVGATTTKPTQQLAALTAKVLHSFLAPKTDLSSPPEPLK
jgi:hypothetical protein